MRATPAPSINIRAGRPQSPSASQNPARIRSVFLWRGLLQPFHSELWVQPNERNR